MGGVALALVGFFAFVMLRMSQPAMGVLFTDMSPSDAAAVTRELDTRGVKYETREDGGTVLAPKSDLAKLRMEFAGKGLPAGGSVGYEIFDKGDAFSSTSFVQNINQLRALEGELARSIRTIGRVQSARVHLAMPERRLFERDREPPRASIILKLNGELGAEQVGAIRHLAASAVEGLTPERVSIVDERGRLLADGSGSGAVLVGMAADEKRVALERRLRSQVEELMTGIVGAGRSRVQVAAELDLNRVESRSENYDPESRVVRSTQTRGENATTAANEGQVSVGNELPGARGGDAAPVPPKEASNKNEEVVNYEISRTTRTEVQEAGRLRRLSVAVLVDGVRARAKDGKDSYQPRSAEDLGRIATLVRSAIGFDKARGDQVEVVNMQFADGPAEVESAAAPSLVDSLFHPTKDDIMRMAEIGILGLLTLVVLMVVVRPMVRKVLAPDLIAASPVVAALAGAPAALAAALAPPLAGGGVPGSAIAATAGGAAGGAVGGAVPVASIGDIAKSNPRETAAVLKNWIAES